LAFDFPRRTGREAGVVVEGRLARILRKCLQVRLLFLEVKREPLCKNLVVGIAQNPICFLDADQLDEAGFRVAAGIQIL
jgi:hypothetical protein